MKALVASSCSGISKRLARLRNELPVIALGVERQLEDAVSVVVARFAVGLGRAKRPVGIFPTAAHHEFTNAVVFVRFAVGVLRREALVVVVMPLMTTSAPAL